MWRCLWRRGGVVVWVIHLLISGHDRRTAPKFGTHVRIDTLTIKKLTHPTPGGIGGYRLPFRNKFLDSTEAHNTSKQDARTTLWVEEWNVLGEQSTEWRDRGIITHEHLARAEKSPWSTWRSLNRLRVQKGRCLAMMKMWKLSHTSSYDIWWCPQLHVDRPGYANPCRCQLCQNTGRNISNSNYRGLDEEEVTLDCRPMSRCRPMHFLLEKVQFAHSPIAVPNHTITELTSMCNN